MQTSIKLDKSKNNNAGKGSEKISAGWQSILEMDNSKHRFAFKAQIIPLKNEKTAQRN